MGQYAKEGPRIGGERSIEYYDENGNWRETRVGGTRSWRNNNPGNLQGSDLKIGQEKLPKEKEAFAIFPSMEVGDQARQHLIGGHYRNDSIRDMIRTYAPEGENNVPAYLTAVKRAGLDPEKRISDLTPEELERLYAAMREHEGMGKGKIIQPTDPGPSATHPDPAAKPDDPTPVDPTSPPKTGDSGNSDADPQTKTAQAGVFPPPSDLGAQDDLSAYAKDIVGAPVQMAPMCYAQNETDDQSGEDGFQAQPPTLGALLSSSGPEGALPDPGGHGDMRDYAQDIAGGQMQFAPTSVALAETGDAPGFATLLGPQIDAAA